MAQDHRLVALRSPCATSRTSGDRPAAPVPASRRPRGRGARRSCSQSSAGHREASTKRSAEAGTDCAPNSLTKRTRRGTRRASSASSPTSPRCQPSQRWVSVPSSRGRCGIDPTVGDGRPGRVGLLERPLQPAVEDRLVPRRQLLGDEAAEASRPALGAHLRGVGHRLVVGAPLDDRGVVPEGVDGLACLADGLAPDLPGVAPLHREVLQQQDPHLVGGPVQLVTGDVRLDAQRVEAGLDRQLDVAPDLVRAWRRRARVGSAGCWRP